MKCEYCKDEFCGIAQYKTVKEWNKCPWHRADWETNTSIFYWVLDVVTFGAAKHFIFKYKLKLYEGNKT